MGFTGQHGGMDPQTQRSRDGEGPTGLQHLHHRIGRDEGEWEKLSYTNYVTRADFAGGDQTVSTSS